LSGTVARVLLAAKLAHGLRARGRECGRDPSPSAPPQQREPCRIQIV